MGDHVFAGTLAAAHAAIAIHLVEDAARNGRTLRPGEIEAAMIAFASLVEVPRAVCA